MDHPLVVSSIKGNIGHCEAASGAAGLAKLLLMFRNKEILKQANFSQLNPHLAGLKDSGMVIPTQNYAWRHSKSQPRRAMLNNFGAAGSNVALLLEEKLDPLMSDIIDDGRPFYVFNLSAKSRKALEASVQAHQAFLSLSKPSPLLKDVCYTASARRQIHNHRISIVCSSNEDLRTKLRQVDLKIVEPSQASNGISFAFSGQGSIYRGMGEGLMETSLYFREQMIHCDRIIQDLGFPSFASFLAKDSTSTAHLSASDETIASQIACVALEYSLAKLFMSWNVVPDYVVGHRYALFGTA